jgi:branched-subunit amino acid transport protein
VSTAWAVVLIVGAATVAIKSSGPLLAGGRALPARLEGVVVLLAPALLAALVTTQTLADSEGELALDERAAGVAAAGVAVALRAPVLVAVVVAAATTALLRL